MKKFYLIGFTLLMLFDTLGQISFKLAAIQALPLEASITWLVRVFAHIWIYGALVGYIGAFFTWMTLLHRVAVGPAFAASHLEVISVMLLSYWLFNEPITWIKFFGAVLILTGIICLAIAEQQLEKTQNIKVAP